MRTSEIRTAVAAFAFGLGPGAVASVAQTTDVSGTVRDRGTVLRQAVVYLTPREGTLDLAPDEGVTINQVRLRFEPGVVVVTPGSVVDFLNGDEVVHNVFGPGSDGNEFDLGRFSQSESRSHRFDAEGVHVALCHIHPEMVAYVLVVPTPYRAVTGSDGTFEIVGVPPGPYRLHAWHSRRRREITELDLVVTPGGIEGLIVSLRPSIEPTVGGAQKGRTIVWDGS